MPSSGAWSCRYNLNGMIKGPIPKAMPGANFPGNKVGGGFNSDYMWRNRNFHLVSHESLDGIASKSLVWYVMAGPWQNALAFAKKLR